MSEFIPDAELTLEIDETGNGSVANNLTTTVEGFVLDARQGRVLDAKKLDKTSVANNLTTTQEGYALDARQGRLLERNKIGFDQIANDLSTSDPKKVLSAEQGRLLSEKLTELEKEIDELPETPDTPEVTPESIGAVTMKLETVTILASKWANNKVYVEAPNVPADGNDNSVTVSPAPESFDEYVACGVRCTAQSKWTLAFRCKATPASDLTVHVQILK